MRIEKIRFYQNLNCTKNAQNKASKTSNPIFNESLPAFYSNYRPLGLRAETKIEAIKNVESLYEITTNEEKSKKFFDEILSDPRKSKQITRELIKKAGGINEFQNWYFAHDGYKNAYSKYIQRVFDNANSPDDLLKISPNWHPEALERKFGNEFSFGKIPPEIGCKEDYQKLVSTIMENGANIPNVKEFKGGMSGKRAFLLTYGDKKYVLKVQQYAQMAKDAVSTLDTDSKTKKDLENYQKNNEHMRSDSCFINAMIDRYLNLNNCENALKMYYFDSETSSVLYEFAQGEKFDGELNILNVNSTLKDLNSLSIVYNDVSADNLKVNNGRIKIIDSGESNFINILKPTVPMLQFELPNWSGNGVASFQAGMFSLKDN